MLGPIPGRCQQKLFEREEIYLSQIHRQRYIFILWTLMQCWTLPPSFRAIDDIFNWVSSIGIRIMCITETAMRFAFTMRMCIDCLAIFFACVLTTSGIHIQFGSRGNIEHLWPKANCAMTVAATSIGRILSFHVDQMSEGCEEIVYAGFNSSYNI